MFVKMYNKLSKNWHTDITVTFRFCRYCDINVTVVYTTLTLTVKLLSMFFFSTFT